MGGVARAALSSTEALQAVAAAGGFKTLVHALSEEDPQAQCFAAAAVGELPCCYTHSSHARGQLPVQVYALILLSKGQDPFHMQKFRTAESALTISFSCT